MAQTISIREYARRHNVSHVAVMKAISTGKITSGLVTVKGRKNKMINPDVADKEWSGNYNHLAKSKNEKVAADFQEPVKSEPAREPESNLGTMAQIQKVKAIFDTKIRELEYKEKTGKLVEKEAVYAALMRKGLEVRAKIEAVPERCIDEVISAGSRSKAYQVLKKAIYEALMEITTMPKIK